MVEHHKCTLEGKTYAIQGPLKITYKPNNNLYTLIFSDFKKQFLADRNLMESAKQAIKEIEENDASKTLPRSFFEELAGVKEDGS